MKTFWTKKGIAQCEVHPIFGSLTFLQKINPGLWMADIYNKYRCPYVGIWVFWRPGLVVNCPSIARNILLKDSDNFRNRLLGTGTADKLGTLNLFTCNDPLWTIVRKKLTSVFTASKLRGWEDLYKSKSADLVQRIKSDNENGITNSLKPLFADYATDIIGESAFGIKCEATKHSTGPLRAMTKEFEKYDTFRGIQWSSIFFFPELADFLRFTFWPKHTMTYFRKVFSMIVKERGGYEKETDGRRDLMDALLKMKQDAMKENQNLDEVVVISNAMIFLQGGYDTTATTLTYIIYELAHHPQYQQKVYEELIEAKSNNDDKELKESDLGQLPYFNAVIKETLRKYPVMGWLDRIALKEYQVDQHLTIPAGTVVYININGMQQDPVLFPDPTVFKPERFLPENVKNIKPYTYMPFGEGPRSCIGKRFGMISLSFALAALISNFILKPLPNAPAPNDAAIDNKGMFYSPGEALSVQFISRN
ncbi:unnamed protein product [Arctia plantaginis]|uniref:unspecific monooxygenase n=1 Tax=Arctia plantaginis TaxID=874455 RepID=A0A8S1ACM7_ARCPL|nr:unnamed protein product [Arctia plantaginis]